MAEVWIVAFDQFADEEVLIQLEGNLPGSDADPEVALVVLEEALEFVDGLGGDDDTDFVALGEFDIDIRHGEAAAIGGH